MFRLLGRKVELYTHKITWREGEDEHQENYVSTEHKDEVEQLLTNKRIDFVTTEINQTGNGWFNGLLFDSYDEALEVFNKGEQAYLQSRAQKELVDNLRLRADIDYIAIMAGVEA